MESYNRVEKPKKGSPINKNEIRITSVGLIRNYISYAITLLHEKGVKDIVLKAMGQAISKTVTISEILKSKIPGLHQDVAISSMSITDVFEPIEEGLVPVELIRHVSMISITLSFTELNHDSPGYQAPVQIDQSKPQYQKNQSRLPYNAYREDSYGRHGRGRGGYGNYQGSYQGKYQGNYREDYQENDGRYSNWGRGRGRGRSYGYRDNGYQGGVGSYGGGRDGGYGGRIGGRYGGGRDDGYGGAKDHEYGGARDKGYGGGRENGYGGGREDGYGRRYQGYVGAKDDGYGGGRDHGYDGGGRDQGYGGRGGGFRGGNRGDRYVGGRDGGYGGSRGGYGRYEDRSGGYGGGQGHMYEGGRGGYGGGGRGYGRGRGRMGNGGRSRGGASYQNQP